MAENSLTTDLNVSPYFDDYDEDKKFHKILFRPGFAVQARELTQMQTILQNQVDRMGEHIFKEGTIVIGCELSFDRLYNYVKLRDLASDGATDFVAANWANTTVTGTTSGVTARVVNQLDGAESANPDYNTIWVKYTNSGTDSATQTYASGEILTSNTGYSANSIASSATGTGSAVTINEGVIFAKDHFVKVSKQTLILDKYSNSPSYKIGYNLTESIISDSNDTSLLDPASGSFNFAAPGAHRLKITATLAKKLATDDLTDFFELYEMENGISKVRGDRTQYAELRKEFARRTYDESGHYSLDPMHVRVREHLDDTTNNGWKTAANGGDINKLAIGIEPGKAFVNGFEYETLYTQFLAANKGTTTREVESQAIPANYGNYVEVNEVSGHWSPDELQSVTLYDTPFNAVSNGTFGTSVTTGRNAIGTAKVRANVFSSGNPGDSGAVYKLYLFDIQMTANSFGFAYGIATGSGGFADTVLTATKATLNETGFNRLVFPIPQSAIKRLTDATGNTDNTYSFMREFDVTIPTSGAFTVDTGGGSELWSFSTGALNATQKDDNFYVVTDAAATITLSGQAHTNTTSNTLYGDGTAFTTELNIGDYVKIDSNGPYKIAAIGTDESATITTQPGAKGANGFTKFIYDGTVLDMAATGSNTGAARTVTIDTTQVATLDIQETLQSGIAAKVVCNVQKTDGTQTAKTYRSSRYVMLECSTHYANTVGPWGLGLSDVFQISEVRRHTSRHGTTTAGTDVTTDFELDDGQRDNWYEHGRLKKKPNSGLNINNGDYLLVKLDHFEHDTSGGEGFLSVASYPIDDSNSANTTAITTQSIPIFTSPTTGTQYNLRDSIDLRPIRTNVANTVTSLVNLSTNPANSSAWTIHTNGQHLIEPNESLTTDLEYYVGRKDRVVMTADGTFSLVSGIPSLYPKTPHELDGSMTMGVVTIPPYPSLPPNIGRTSNRPEMTVSIRQEDNRRYTMRDIGALEQRINNLEYYTSLSLLEESTSEKMILNSNGDNRFKNGMLVDPFSGHNVGNINDEDYACSIDTTKKELRPKFHLKHVGMRIDANNSTNYYRTANDVTLTVTAGTGTFSNGEPVFQGGTLSTATAQGVLRHDLGTAMYVEQSQGTWSTAGGVAIKGNTSTANGTVTAVSTATGGDLVMLPYTHSIYLDQPYASQGINTSSELLFNWVGNLSLDPDNDIWTDTTVQPEVQINFDNNSDNWERLADAWGTQWGNWETVWAGSTSSTSGSRWTGTTTTTTTTQSQTRQGISVDVQPEQQIQRLGAKVVDVSIQPFMRSRIINVTASRLKPSTRVFPFFDGIDVSSYCATANTTSGANTSAFGGVLVTDSSGDLSALFRIPNEDALRFRTGLKPFRLTDSSTNSNTDVTTSTQTNYNAMGLHQTTQDTVLSTRTAPLDINSLNDERTQQTTSITNVAGERRPRPIDNPDVSDDGADSDPLSQSFYIRATGGMFVSKLDLWFKEKSSTLGLTVEIREMINGLPGPRKLPFGVKHLTTGDVNTSATALLPTQVVFDSPVYLKNEQEYCIVLRPDGNNPDYVTWVADLGQNDVTHTTYRITKQAATGVLFTSANDRTWNQHQSKDLKYRIYRANFNTAVTGSVRLVNEDSEFFTLTTANAGFNTGEPIHGETRLVVANTASVNVGETVLGTTSGANGVIVDITGATLRVKGVTTNAAFSASEALTFRWTANQQPTSANTSINSLYTPRGALKYYNSIANNATWPKMFLGTTTQVTTGGSFIAGEQIRGQYSEKTSVIHRLDNVPYHSSHPQAQTLVLPETTVTWGEKGTSTGNVVDTTDTVVQIAETHDWDNEKRVVGKTNEAANLSGAKSVQLTATMNSDRSTVSPIVDLGKVGKILVENLINNDAVGEDQAAGSSILAGTAYGNTSSNTIYGLSTAFVTDLAKGYKIKIGDSGPFRIHAVGTANSITVTSQPGNLVANTITRIITHNAHARYVTRRVVLDDTQDAEDLRVYLTGYKPSGTDIKVYYKIHNQEDEELFDDKLWVEMTQSTNSTTVSDSEDREDFKEFEYVVPTANLSGPSSEIEYTNSAGASFRGFLTFAIKVVMLSGNKALPSRVKELRVIAMQQ